MHYQAAHSGLRVVPEMLNIFHYAPKPKQVYRGGPTPKHEKISCIDAIACRENAIVDSDLALPVFSPLDEPEVCQDENGERYEA